jgi:hypothetical protein
MYEKPGSFFSPSQKSSTNNSTVYSDLNEHVKNIEAELSKMNLFDANTLDSNNDDDLPVRIERLEKAFPQYKKHLEEKIMRLEKLVAEQDSSISNANNAPSGNKY